MENDYTPPDPYAAGIAAMRAAGATSLSTFAERYKNMRMRALEIDYAEIDAHIAAAPHALLTAGELKEYAPPVPYAARIKLLQQKEAR